MAAALVDVLPEGREWLYEAKFDGYRAIAIKDAARIRLLSRKGNDLSKDYRAVVMALGRLQAANAVIDGEIVAFDADGRPSFQQLQHRAASTATIRYFAFDLLYLNGNDLTKAPLSERRRLLMPLVREADVDFSDELRGTPAQVVRAVAQVGLEGVVAKRRDSRYEPGKRSGVWQKFKIQHRQEFVIGGFKPENRSFQSIVVGYYESKRLRFAGRVRAGFTPAQRSELFQRLKPLHVERCPFADLPTGKTGQWGEGVTEEDMKILKWVRPWLVAEIAFTEWTRDGHLRHSSFVGVRDDKKADEVVREA
jgi:bifunctional non-homologous end joining protein LigD